MVGGTVTGITHFGAFVSLEGGGSGLIHISEVAYEYVRDVRDHVGVGDRVEVKVVGFNATTGKLELSLKQTRVPPPEVAGRGGRFGRGRRKALAEGADPAFEEKLSKFLKSSEERLVDVKRNLEAKRGRGYR